MPTGSLVVWLDKGLRDNPGPLLTGCVGGQLDSRTQGTTTERAVDDLERDGIWLNHHPALGF
jgi:hypothetical protein